MEENTNVKKIIVKQDYELTDIVSEILNSTEGRIILTFAEESDILISPINLKVILETADENNKLIIAQIIRNPSGSRNAKLAGLQTIETPNTPSNDIWDQVMKQKDLRLNPPMKEVTQELEINEEETKQPIAKTSSDFEKRINEAIQKSRDRKIEKIDTEEESFISFDDDIPNEKDITPTEEREERIDFSKVDFKNAPQSNSKDIIHEKRVASKKTFDLNKLIHIFSKKNNDLSTNNIVSVKKNPQLSKFKKIIPLVIIPLVAITILTLFAYYKISSFVKVKIYVQAKEVSIEEIFTGDVNIKEIDFDNKKIPIKNESVEKSRSTNITATGKAFKGEKAKGTVMITYTKGGDCQPEEKITLPAGSRLTSSSGYSYNLDSQTVINCNGMTEGSVQAIEVGEEYNISSGSFFTIQGYSSSQVYGLNSTSAFTGGSKEEYTVLSQNDVDIAIKELEETAKEEGENELKEKYNNWVIVEDSIKSEIIKGSIKTDVAVGAEAGNVNVSLKTESKATYYLKDGFDKGLNSLLTKKAENENLFESDEKFQLKLGDDIKSNISVLEDSKDSIQVKLTATGSVKPDINKQDIINKLKGKSWEEGNKIIKSLVYSNQETDVIFNPESIPERFWYFPDKQGGILIEIKEVTE